MLRQPPNQTIGAQIVGVVLGVCVFIFTYNSRHIYSQWIKSRHAHIYICIYV